MDAEFLSRLLGIVVGGGSSAQPSSDMAEFRQVLSKAKHIVVLSGAGVSAESGVPTFRGAGGYWRTFQVCDIFLFDILYSEQLTDCQHHPYYKAQQVATPESFAQNPSLVWEFYSYRREVMHSKSPNAAHIAIAELEKRLEKQGRKVVVITQNIDRLHHQAGSRDVIELHGSLFDTECTKCGDVRENRDSPIVPALKDKGSPNSDAQDAKIPVEELPRCKECKGLLRPHVIWFGESLDEQVMKRTHEELGKCDLCLLVGTSSVVYPAAAFAPMVAARGVPVAEFNLEETQVTGSLKFHFQGKCGEILPPALTELEDSSDKIEESHTDPK